MTWVGITVASVCLVYAASLILPIFWREWRDLWQPPEFDDVDELARRHT